MANLVGILIRAQIFEANKERLAMLAYRATVRGLRLEDVVVLCIDVDSDDGFWRQTFLSRMPEAEGWQKARAEGERPISRATVRLRDVFDILTRLLPDLRSTLETPPTPGETRAVVLADGGGSIFSLRPEAGELKGKGLA